MHLNNRRNIHVRSQMCSPAALGVGEQVGRIRTGHQPQRDFEPELSRGSCGERSLQGSLLSLQADALHQHLPDKTCIWLHLRFGQILLLVEVYVADVHMSDTASICSDMLT